MNNKIINGNLKDLLYLKGNSNYSELHFINGEIQKFDTNLNDIINKLCIHFGSDLRGRRIASKALIPYTYKVPIHISSKHNLLVFEITNFDGNDTFWFNYHNVKRTLNKKDEICKIEFIDGHVEEFNFFRRYCDRQLEASYDLYHICKECDNLENIKI